ncbi:YbjQ family protein [Neomegalonema sp.]|uniref:YbjQ family protein n=1 Tax=Neomegalonema sp. TaxID=2039713 RepID=UPI002630FCB4|nr:YbjQ family protein [Neomegalonema sp.]MDD2867127.1 YbjQ family protein [Neomegalonema sp.]
MTLIMTIPEVPGHQIDRVLGVVTAESVQGVNIVKDVFAAVRDVVGGRSATLENMLRQCRDDCMRELDENARRMGADAVVGLRSDYFSANNMMILTLMGTAVTLRR